MIKLINFCTNIRKFRLKADLTQSELAEKLGISQNYLSSIENGKRVPPAEIILALFEIFYVSPNELFGYEAGEMYIETPPIVAQEDSHTITKEEIRQMIKEEIKEALQNNFQHVAG